MSLKDQIDSYEQWLWSLVPGWYPKAEAYRRPEGGGPLCASCRPLTGVEVLDSTPVRLSQLYGNPEDHLRAVSLSASALDVLLVVDAAGGDGITESAVSRTRCKRSRATLHTLKRRQFVKKLDRTRWAVTREGSQALRLKGFVT
jgi:hypothetical protein